MNKGLKILTIAMITLCVTVAAYAGSVWNAYDTASPFAIRFTDEDVTGSIQVALGAIYLVDDGNTNTIYATNTVTLADVMANMNAATNTSGDKNFEAAYWAGIAADHVYTNHLEILAKTTLSRQWNYDVEWDTDVCLHYDSAIGILVGAQPTPVAAGKIDHIFGDPLGTGDVTLSVYVDGSVKWSRLITSPVYITPSSMSFITYAGTNNTLITTTNTLTYATEPSAAFDFEVNIPVGSQPAFVRAARATTATTGGIGISDIRR